MATKAQLNSSVDNPQKDRLQLLICADWYAPGINAGGPIRSCVNLVELLGSDVLISVITSNRDLGAAAPYIGIEPNAWIRWRQRADVYYASSAINRMVCFAKALDAHPDTTVYLNSMFSVAGTLWPLLWMWLIGSPIQIVLAPRGMLKPSALRQKSWKKKPLLAFMRLLGLLRNVRFHATSSDEIQEIRQAFGDAEIRCISNVPVTPVESLPNRIHTTGAAHLCFVGRVHPIKNLLWLLDGMALLKTNCLLTVVGPIEDEEYFKKCETVATALPENVSVDFVGAQPPARIQHLLIKADALILPTLGENFGHAIFESLAVGTPAIVSDQTIWRDLEAKSAGWDLPLSDVTQYVEAIERLATNTEQEQNQLRQGALNVASAFLRSNDVRSQYWELFL